MPAARPHGGSILIGFADALAAPEVAASLIAAGYSVASFARRGRKVSLRKLRGVELTELTPPEEDLAACEAELAALAAGHDLVMPLDDQAVFVCDGALAPDTPLAGPRGTQARLALDKRLQLLSAEAAGLAVPPWQLLTPETGAFENWNLPPELGLPAVLKPALAAEQSDGRLRRLAPRLVRDTAQAEELRRTWGPRTATIVQRWVSGTGAGVFGIADENGIHNLSAHRRVRMMNPAGSGSSACASAPVPQELVDPIERMLKDAGWRGLFMVELLRDDERWWFMELNGRSWGSMALARRLGYEYPAWAAARALDPQAPPPPAPKRATDEQLLCRHLGRELVHLMFVLRGPGSHPGAWPGRGQTVKDLLHGSRDSAWYNLGPGMRELFLDDALRTVAGQTWAKKRA
jgi:hypothetical protein